MTIAGTVIEHKRLLRRTIRFGPSTCFLCSALLRSKNRSDEHVFPKWLQKRFNLWDQRLDLINLTGIPYRQLTIPCCKTCNNIHLSKIEDIMRSAVEAGPSAVADLPSATVYMWLSKIFYGVLYRERQNASTGQMEGRTASRDSLKVSFCFIHLNPGAPSSRRSHPR